MPYTTLSPESLVLFLQQNLKPRLDTIEQKVWSQTCEMQKAKQKLHSHLSQENVI
ncbi:MAG: hypothetical protein WCL08_08790 [Verrucomicrobiota bacterium]